MKTQEEYAREIDEIVRRDVESCQSDWFKIDKEIFMQPKNKNKIFILGTRKTGCDLIILGGTNCDEGRAHWWDYQDCYITISHCDCDDNSLFSDRIKNSIEPELWISLDVITNYLPDIKQNHLSQ